jgi:polyhydroxyalkanoate synthesis regulator phasin
MPDQPNITPQSPLVDESKIRAKLSGKYSPEDVNSFISFAKQNPQALQKPSKVSTTQPEKAEAIPTSVIGDALKSTWNGFFPEMAKGVTLIPKLVTNFTGNHSDWLDGITKIATDAIDKYATLDIPKEYQGSLLDNPRSFINGLGNGAGMLMNALALAALTGGAGDVAEATASVSKAAEAYSAGELGLEEFNAAKVGLDKAISSQRTINTLSGSAAFTAQMINPIFEKGKAAGLSDIDNARMTLLLAPVVGAAGTVLPGAFKTAEKGLWGSEIIDATTKGLEEDLTKLASADDKNAAFKSVFKDATERMNTNLKDRIGEVGKGFAEGAGNMFFINAIQNAGEQLYDNLYADKGAQAGKGKFGTDVFGKKEFIENLQSSLLGGFLGMGAATLHKAPVFDQTLYGYLDGAIRKGEGDKATEKLNKVIDTITKSGQITEDDAKVVKDKLGKIKATAESFKQLEKFGTPIDADMRYDAYNLQNNVKQDIINNGIKPHEEAQAAHDRMQLQLDAEKNGAPPDPSVNPAIVAKMADIVEKGMPEYNKAKEKVAAIDAHLTELGKTGRAGNITEALNAIDEKYKPKEEIKPKESSVETTETEVKPDKFAGYDAESLHKERVTVQGEVDAMQSHLDELKKQNTSGLFDEDVAKAEKELADKQQDLLSLNDKLKQYEESKTNGDTSTREVATSEKRDETVANVRQADDTVSTGAEHDRQQEGRQRDKEKVDLDSLNGAKVSYKGIEGTISIDEGGKVSFEGGGKTYDIPTESSNRNALYYGISPAKEKYNVSDVSEESATVNGNKYKIVTDDKGNVVGLSPENKPNQVIKNEKLLVAVEIERNKSSYKSSENLSEKEADALIRQTVSDLPLNEKAAAVALENIYNTHLNEPTSQAIDDLYDGKKITKKQQALISAWSQKVESDIRSLQFGEKGEDLRSSELVKEALTNLDFINRTAKENVESKNISEVDTSKSGQVEKTQDQIREEVNNLPNEAKQELRDKLKDTVKKDESYKELLRKMRDEGAIEINCKGTATI